MQPIVATSTATPPESKLDELKKKFRAHIKTRIGVTVFSWIVGFLLILLIGVPLATINKTFELGVMVAFTCVRKLSFIQVGSIDLQHDHCFRALRGLRELPAECLLLSRHHLLPLALVHRTAGHRFVLHDPRPSPRRPGAAKANSNFHCHYVEHHLLG